MTLPRALPLALSLVASAPNFGTAQNATAALIASNLSNPVDLASPSGDPRLFIVQLPGQVRVMESGDLLSTSFLDASGWVQGGACTGLRSLAFHPEYTSNGYAYMW